MTEALGNVGLFAFAQAPCPDCQRPLRPVGGGTTIIGSPPTRRHRVDEYRCEQGHVFFVTVERLESGATVTSALHREIARKETHVHFA